jgi:hypothetical protein
MTGYGCRDSTMIECFGSGRRKDRDFGLESGFSARVGHDIKGDAGESKWCAAAQSEGW